MDHFCNLLDFVKQSFHKGPLPHEETKNDNPCTDPR